jgi:hypothetical protein
MLRLGLVGLVLAAALACTSSGPLAVAPNPAAETAGWPPAEAALQAASAAMSDLQTLREEFTIRTYLNNQPDLSAEVTSAYVAPDRRYRNEKGGYHRAGVQGIVDEQQGEVVQVGTRLYRRAGAGAWQERSTPEPFVWPGAEHQFLNARKVAWLRADTLDGRPVRVLSLEHDGGAVTADHGWLYQTRLWIDPASGYVLRRESRGTRNDPDPSSGKPIARRQERNWVYLSHNAPIVISEPTDASPPSP